MVESSSKNFGSPKIQLTFLSAEFPLGAFFVELIVRLLLISDRREAANEHNLERLLALSLQQIRLLIIKANEQKRFVVIIEVNSNQPLSQIEVFKRTDSAHETNCRFTLTLLSACPGAD